MELCGILYDQQHVESYAQRFENLNVTDNFVETYDSENSEIEYFTDEASV